MLDDLAAHFIGAAPVEGMMGDLVRLCAYDRYQASDGIEQAALLVAERARAIGLSNVQIDRYPADGQVRWWSFRAPTAWTPRIARLRVRGGDGRSLQIDHAQDPFSVATYSAATPRGGTNYRLIRFSPRLADKMLAGKIAVVTRAGFGRDLLRRLSHHGCAGFITDCSCVTSRPCDGNGSESQYPGRIELEPETPLFGFSVTSHQLSSIQEWAANGAEAHVEIEVDRAAAMPVVSAVIPGESSEREIWLIGHLCHPRPGANDNASGVAALLGVAGALLTSRMANPRWQTSRTIRFVWGPEFVGPAAMLHRQIVAHGSSATPAAVINMDMVGQNQTLCEGPFVIERSPDFRTSAINPLAEHLVAQVFRQTSHWPGIWTASPFVGYSDHALFADPKFDCSTVQFCHVPDRFNHSSGDSVEKICPIEMRRATAAAAALIYLLAKNQSVTRPAIELVVKAWCTDELSRAHEVASRYRHAKDATWSPRFIRYVLRRLNELQSVLELAEPGIEPSYVSEGSIPSQSQNGVMARWAGPVNFRGILADLPVHQRSVTSDLIKNDKCVYAILLNMAIRANGRKTRDAIISETSFALRCPIDATVASRLFDLLLESGWLVDFNDQS
jgi:hypothetical protein